MISMAALSMVDTVIQQGSVLVEELTGVLVPEYRRPLLRAEFERIGGEDGISGGFRRVVAGDREARSQLLSTVTIPETYLFRHFGHFELIRELARLRARDGRGLRVLSAGCSTGEEVWSVAAVLASVGELPNNRYSVVGWELCDERLQIARVGRYTKWSCRNGLKGLDRFFLDHDDRTEAGPELRGMVSFNRVNLVEENLPNAGLFDVILLRNVAIYWSETTTQRVSSKLASMVAEGGVFLAGPSDPVHLPSAEWEHRISQGVRSYRRRPPEMVTRAKANQPGPVQSTVVQKEKAESSTGIAEPRTGVVAPGESGRLRFFGHSSAQVEPDTPRGKARPSKAEDSADGANRSCLDRARALADLGEYSTAYALLENDEEGQTVEGKLWRGILSLSLENNDEAVRLFRQCVFLRPEVREYHRWLAIGLEATGWIEEAARCRKNAFEIGEL